MGHLEDAAMQNQLASMCADGTRADRLAGSFALSPVTARRVVRQVKLRLGLTEPATTRKRRGTEHQGTSRAGELMMLAGWHPYQVAAVLLDGAGNGNRGRGMRIVLAAAAVAVLITACGSGTAVSVRHSNAQAPPSATAPDPPPSSTAPGPQPVGTTFTITDHSNGTSYDVTLVKLLDPAAPDSSFDAAEAGSHLAGAEFTLHGDAGKVQDDANNDASTQGSDDEIYLPVFTGLAAGTDFSSGEFNLTAGRTVTGWVAFSVKDGVSVSTVSWAPGSGLSDAVVTWKVKGK